MVWFQAESQGQKRVGGMVLALRLTGSQPWESLCFHLSARTGEELMPQPETSGRKSFPLLGKGWPLCCNHRHFICLDVACHNYSLSFSTCLGCNIKLRSALFLSKLCIKIL